MFMLYVEVARNTFYFIHNDFMIWNKKYSFINYKTVKKLE